MMEHVTCLFFLLLVACSTQSQLKPPSYPLAVRTPYLSAWLPGGNVGGILAGGGPQFWTGDPLRWTGIIRVDGDSYLFMGNPGISNLRAVEQIGVEYTASATYFYSIAGPLNITITFLSPITPKDLLRQSLPFSYLEISFKPTDGQSHQVQVYTDIDAAWAARDPKSKVTWEYINTNNNNDISLFSVSLVDTVQYGEFQQMTQYGNAFYGTLQSATVQSGTAKEVIAEFLQNGKLNGAIATPPVLLPNAPVFALSTSFEPSNSIQSSLFAIGHVRNPVALFNNSIPQYYYLSKVFSSSFDAFEFFLQDYENVTEMANEFDAQLVTDANAVAENYIDLVALSARQAFGGIEFTTDKSATDTVVYLKEISSDGNVNTVDVIMPSIPIWLYTNPSILGYLLLPLLRYQDNGKYPHQWAMHDAGFHYPNAAGHPLGNDEQMPIEESGNMILMALAHARATGDSTLLVSYYHLFHQWADYLVNNTLIPGFQLATTDAAGPLANQTNLAVKGIIALQAMAHISNLTNHPNDASYYQRVAESYILQWVNFSMGSDGKHIKLAYQNDTSWGIQFNLFMDTLLNLNIVPEHVYQLLDVWYLGVANKYGVQLDTRVDWGKTDWNMWCAGSSSKSTQQMILTTTLEYIHSGDSQGPLPDRYDTNTGSAVGGIRARPTVGAHFSLLLKQLN